MKVNKVKFLFLGVLFLFLIQSHGVAVAAEANYLWPVLDSTTLSRGYSSSHAGIDITANSAVPIRATKSGTVEKVYSGCRNSNGYYAPCSSKGICSPSHGYYDGRCNYGYGNGVVINHGNGYYSHYAHMESVNVGVGQSVSQGTVLGTMGSTGNSTGRHLHFAIATTSSGSGNRINNNPGTGINYVYSTDSTPPNVDDLKVSELRPGAFTVSAHVTDPSGVQSVRYAVWTLKEDASGKNQDDLVWYDGHHTDGNNVYWAHVNFSEHNGERGVYLIHAYITDNAGNQRVEVLQYTFDSTPPEITNAQITDVSSSGYTVTCTVTDESPLSSVKFPTWTDANGQDDMDQNWIPNTTYNGTIDGNTVSFRVNDKDHNYEKGLYYTHIYAFDQLGNMTKYDGLVVDIKNENKPLASTEWDGKKYLLLDDIQKWSTAKEKCQELGGYLACVSSKEENDVLVKLMGSGTRDGYYLGGTDESSEGQFKWITGESWRYTNWHANEPNNDTGQNPKGQDYLQINREGAWDDDYDNKPYGYICELENEVSVSDMKLDKTSVQMNVGEKITLEATITPTDATNQSIAWSSDSTTVATVSTTGEIKALSPGTATITATTINGKKASCVVTVNAIKPTDELGVSGSVTPSAVKPGGIATVTVNLDNYGISEKSIASMQIEIPNVTDELSYVADSRATIIADGEFSSNTESLIFAYLPFSEGDNILPKDATGLFTFQVQVSDQITEDMDAQLPMVITMGDQNDNPIMEDVEVNLVVPIRKKVIIMGDLNGNGGVDIMDARKAKRAAMRTSDLTEDELEAADINGDGKVSIIEARKIKRVAMKEISIDE